MIGHTAGWDWDRNLDPAEHRLSQTSPEEGLHATVVHPDRELTPEERAHLGLPPADEQGDD